MLAVLRLTLYSFRKRGNTMNNDDNKPVQNEKQAKESQQNLIDIVKTITDEKVLTRIELLIKNSTEKIDIDKYDTQEYWKANKRDFYWYAVISSLTLVAVIYLGVEKILNSETMAVLISVMVAYLYGAAKPRYCIV